MKKLLLFKVFCGLLAAFLLYPTTMELLFTNKIPLTYDEINALPARCWDGRFYNGEILAGHIRYAWSVFNPPICSIQALFNPSWRIAIVEAIPIE